jgi:hypothetical protein
MGEDEIMKKKTRSPQKEPSPEPQVPDPVLHPQVGGTPGQKEHRRIFKDLSEDK